MHLIHLDEAGQHGELLRAVSHATLFRLRWTAFEKKRETELQIGWTDDSKRKQGNESTNGHALRPQVVCDSRPFRPQLPSNCAQICGPRRNQRSFFLYDVGVGHVAAALFVFVFVRAGVTVRHFALAHGAKAHEEAQDRALVRLSDQVLRRH